MRLYLLRWLRLLGLASFCISVSMNAETIYTPYLISSVASSNSVLFFNEPYDVAADSVGNLYVADTYNFAIWKLTRNGTNKTFTPTVLAGAVGYAGASDGTGSAARFTYPEGVAVDSNGNVFVADSSNYEIRKITPGGVVTTIAQAPDVGFVSRITVDKNGTVYAVDGNAGIAVVGQGGGVSRLGSYNFNGGLCVDTNGTIFATDEYRHVIFKVTGGSPTVIAGTDGQTGSNDGIGTAAQFSTPDDIDVDTAGNLYVADTGNDLLRKITFDGTNYVVRTMAGVPGAQGNTDGSDSSARFGWPTGITVDSAGTVYTAEVKTDRIRAAVYNGPTNAANIWTNTVNGKWEDGLSWSIGIPSIEDEVDYITNDFSKAVVIDANTAPGRPGVLNVNNILVSAPDGYVNGLVLYNSTQYAPLQIKQQLAIDSGGTVAVTNGTIQMGVGLTVGFNNGNALLNVYNSGRVSSPASYLGYNADSSAAHVGGLGALWTNQNLLSIGYYGDENGLLIENGGAVGSATASIGNNGNNNSVVVTGSGSTWRNPGSFVVGDVGGSGNSVTIVNGGAVYTGGSGLQIGNGGDGNVVTVSGMGSLLSCAGPLQLTKPTQSTYNALYVGAGATVTTPSLIVSNGNFVGIAGGTLNTASTIVDNGVVFPVGVGTQSATLHLNGGVHIFNGGLEVTDHATVTGCGTIVGPVTIDPGGTIIADSGCAITFNGNVTNYGTIIGMDGTNVDFPVIVVNHGSILTNTPPPPSPCLTVTNGTIVNLADSATDTITVGTNSVQFDWSVSSPGHTGYLYATYTTDVALAPGVTNIDQVTNASTFMFQTSAYSSIGPVTDGDSTGIGQFTILRNRTTHCYAVVRWDDVQSSSINATWWLQTKPGETNFSCSGAIGVTGPVAVSNLVAQASGGNLGVNFTTQMQRAYTIQMRTNLTTGFWMSLTNFTGDGSARALSLPITGPQGYYRVLTQ